MPLTEKQKIYHREYRLKHAEKRKRYKQNYAKQNEATLKEPVTCRCGITVQRINMYAHVRSQRHQIFTGQKTKKSKSCPTQVNNIDFAIYFD